MRYQLLYFKHIVSKLMAKARYTGQEMYSRAMHKVHKILLYRCLVIDRSEGSRAMVNHDYYMKQTICMISYQLRIYCAIQEDLTHFFRLFT